MFQKLSAFSIAIFSFISCSKSEVPAIQLTDEIYQIETVKEFDNDIFSISFDSEDKLWTKFENSSHQIGYFNNEWRLNAVTDPDQLFKTFSLTRFFLQGNELFATGPYQPGKDLFYFKNAKNELKPFANPFFDKNNPFGGAASFVIRQGKSQYLVGYNNDVFLMNEDGSSEKKFSEVELDGNQLEANTFAFNGTDRIYYKPYFSFESLAYLDINAGVTKIKSANLLSFDNSKFNYGDGELPNAGIGNVASLCVDKENNVYFLEYNRENRGMRVRMLTKDNVLKTLVGGLFEESIDGKSEEAGVVYATSIAVNSKGEVYLAEQNKLRKVSVVP